MNARATGGSPTATYQAARGQANDLASQLAGYTGAAAGGALGGNVGAAIGGSVGRGMAGQAGGKNAEILARLLQNPQYMAEMLQKAQQSQLLLDIAKRGGSGVAGAAGASNTPIPGM